jgi:TetR/AcrR family transcriptional regulator, transcriptional repressor for nem operon
MLNQSINATDLTATLLAVVQGGYVIARALQDPLQMDRAICGALDLLEINERR